MAMRFDESIPCELGTTAYIFSGFTTEISLGKYLRDGTNDQSILRVAYYVQHA